MTYIARCEIEPSCDKEIRTYVRALISAKLHRHAAEHDIALSQHDIEDCYVIEEVATSDDEC